LRRLAKISAFSPSAREDLRKFVTIEMARESIDVVKVQDKVKVSLKVKTTRGSITKDVILKGLRSLSAETRRRSREPGPRFRTQHL
jgi:hypothetical protein